MRRLAGTMFAVVVAGASAFLAGRLVHAISDDGAREAPTGRIVPANGGPLAEIAIQFHRDTGGQAFLPVYREIFEALEPTTTVWVATADAEDERIFETARRGWGDGPRVRYAPVGDRITNWARDRMAVLSDGGGDAVFVAPPRAHAGARARANDHQVPWALRRAMGMDARIVTAPFAFDGGDLIADDAHTYVATALFGRNPDREPAEVAAGVRALTGRDVITLGTLDDPAPDHHVGMFVTPLGDGVVAYADPELGSTLLFGSASSGAARSVEAGGRPYTVDESHETRRRFARVGDDLRRAGLRTVALPVVPTTTPFVWLGYDNVLIDERPDGMHVLMPTYGVPRLDDAAARVWGDLGATVHPVDVSGIFHLGGTVRCLAAIVRRKAA